MFTFACDSIEGLTLNQKRETLKALKAAISAEVARKREAKAELKALKAENAEAKRQVAIDKARAKLEKLLNKTQPVGRMAVAANRKPSKGTVSTLDMLEANEISKKFASRKAA
jgi:ribosome-associated translation inhibitor RaiA